MTEARIDKEPATAALPRVGTPDEPAPGAVRCSKCGGTRAYTGEGNGCGACLPLLGPFTPHLQRNAGLLG